LSTDGSTYHQRIVTVTVNRWQDGHWRISHSEAVEHQGVDGTQHSIFTARNISDEGEEDLLRHLHSIFTARNISEEREEDLLGTDGPTAAPPGTPFHSFSVRFYKRTNSVS